MQLPLDKQEPTAHSAAYRAKIEKRRDILRAQLSSIFAGQSEFTCELGCGHGHFLTAYAEAHPGKLCVGVDMAGERIERAIRKRNRAGLGNLFFVHAKAALFLETLPSAALCGELFILFPDPWPKLRHHKHRLIQPDFLSAVAARAICGCRLHFRTDHWPYYEHAHAMIRSSPNWELETAPWPFEFETVFQRRAERHDSLIARLCNLSP